MQQVDIICLCEIWYYQEIVKLPEFLNEYNIMSSNASKEKSRDWESRGMAILIIIMIYEVILQFLNCSAAYTN